MQSQKTNQLKNKLQLHTHSNSRVQLSLKKRKVTQFHFFNRPHAHGKKIDFQQVEEITNRVENQNQIKEINSLKYDFALTICQLNYYLLHKLKIPIHNLLNSQWRKENIVQQGYAKFIKSAPSKNQVNKDYINLNIYYFPNKSNACSIVSKFHLIICQEQINESPQSNYSVSLYMVKPQYLSYQLFHLDVVYNIIYQLAMADFEQILEDNIYLKKNLQMIRHQNERLQQELSEQRLLNQEIIDKNTNISESYNNLQKKHQMQMAEHNKDITNLNYQINELKEYIDHKQQQIQEFQLKIIPNLDQDMIRVKLINQMEGPYQEVVEKKDRQITRLKEKLSEVQRKCSLYQLQLQTKNKEQKRQIDETKHFYQGQNERLLKELNAALAKKDLKSYDQHLFKNQRKQLEQLRCTINLQMQNQSQLRRQVSNLKVDKEKLVLQINQLNQNKALQIHLSSENQQIRILKQDRKKLEDQITRKNEQIQKMDKKLKIMEKQFKKNEEQLRNNLTNNRQTWQRERQSYKQDLSKHRADLRKSNDRIERLQQQIQISLQKVKNSEREYCFKKQENQKLKAMIGQLQLSIKHYQLAKKQKLTLSKHLEPNQAKKKVDTEEEVKKENDHKHTNVIINKHGKDQTISNLEKINEKLKSKLEKANQKIIQLLKEKASNPIPHEKIPYSNYRDRAFSNVEVESLRPRTDKAFLLEYRDASFTPLVPPTIFTQHS